jgi:hypothetical protein
MPLRDVFPFRGRENQQFTGWPLPPAVWPIRAKVEGVISALSESKEKNKEQDEGTYPPTLIVAIGKTGEQALSMLAEKIAQSSASGSAFIRALLITETPSLLTSMGGRQIRVLELQQPGNSNSKGAFQSSRSLSNFLFQQVVNYKRYQEWLQETLLDLGTDTQVFFVGSLAEPTIGLLGDALQILANFPQSMGRTDLFSRVCAFLSLRSLSASSLPSEEVFAACREVGRFTFNGPHLMNVSFGQKVMVESALLDYLFVMDDLPIASMEKEGINIAQLLADALFSLFHPSARFLWENLLNDLSLSGKIRQQFHQPVVHSLGIATLYIPLNGIKRYISARLAHAVLFGEQKNLMEGLVKQSASLKEDSQYLARRLLLDGPFPHPIFNWLLDANSLGYFDTVPDLSPDFIMVFQAQIAHSLIKYLNQSPVDLDVASASLAWLDAHISNCENWFKSSKPSRPNAPERFSFQHLLYRWRESLQYLSEDLSNWQKKILSSPILEIPATTPVLTSDWRNARIINKPEGQDLRKSQLGSISEILKTWRLETESALSNASYDSVYRSVLADERGGLKELENYYTDTVRPELSRIGGGAGTGMAFTRIRQHLEWWIQLAPDRLPQLYLVCWPSTMVPSAEPPASVRFRSDQIDEFAAALVELALSQTESLEADLTTKWFGQRSKHLVNFLQRAGDAYLKYDHNLAEQFPNAASRRSYLIAHDPTLSRELVANVFLKTPRFEINELSGGQKTRFTALSLRLNIPFDAITRFQELRREYVEKLTETIHIYHQERTAVVYEKRFWKLNRDRILLVPEVAILLSDPQLVTLYFQTLFTGVLHVEQDDIGNELYWIMSATESFLPLRLAPAGKDGLNLALRRFALELPNAADINQNPNNHFHPSRRLNYISSLTTQAKKLAFKPEIRAIRESLKAEFEVWKVRADQDELARSFHTLITCELDEPVWKGW